MKVLSNASIYLGANLLNAAIPFLLLPVLTRVLTTAEYGTIAMFGVMLSIFNAFTGLSVHGAISVRYFQMKKNELAEYAGSCIGILLISTSLVLIMVILLEPWLVKVSGIPADWLIVAVIISGLQFLINIQLSFWRAAGKAWLYSSFQISKSLLDACLALFLIISAGMAWHGRILGQALTIGCFGFIALLWLFKDNNIKRSKKWNIYGIDALRFGIPLIPHTIGSLLAVASDRTIITNVLGVQQTGIYMVGLQISMAIGLISESFNKAYAPWLMEKLSNPTSDLKALIVKGTYLYFILIISLATIFGLVAPCILKFLVGDDYISASGIIIYCSLGFAFGGCYYIVVNYIFYESKTAFLAKITFITGISNIPLTYILIKLTGIQGAAMSFMITHLLTFIITWVYSHKIYPMPWLKLFYLKLDKTEI
ncbi:hypothetical protein MTYM_01473 [Methylococcales bacterium]|nr:hypothetical protein MTYM_01473 [Methylococcales bacterium]